MKNIVEGHRAERDLIQKAVYVPRDGLSAARKSMQSRLIKVITGPRRAGKSVFAAQMLRGLNYAYLNFDDERLVGLTDYDDLLKAVTQVYGRTKLLFFDEIQNLPNWELFVNRLQRTGFEIVLTGSNAQLLSRELATHLTGRYIPFQVLPFSFAEFLRARGFPPDDPIPPKQRHGLLLHHLNEYVATGGYPEVVVQGVDLHNYLATLFESILFKDIVRRHGVRHPTKLHDLGLYLLTNHSRDFTYTSLKNALNFSSVHTVENYASYLEEAFLFFAVDRYSTKVKEQMRSSKKAYAYDSGMINAVKFKTSPDTGRLIENLVAVELIRRGKEFYYYRTPDGKEVDFAVRDRLKVSALMQVCHEVGDRKTARREMSAILKASKETGCRQLRVLTWDTEKKESAEGKKVVYVPLWKWLLDEHD